LFGFFRIKPERQLRRFRERFSGRNLICHSGFEGDWLEELLKQPGGGGHFRLDVRPLPVARPTPIEWFVQSHILPLGVPLPTLVRLEESRALVRHLRRGNHVVHPSEIAWFLEELESRHHARVDLGETPEDIRVHLGIPISDNEALSMMEQWHG
jgi:hypothetical protein